MFTSVSGAYPALLRLYTVVEEHASPDVIVMILGNKADMTGEKVVKTEQGERLAKVSFILPKK